MQNNVSIQWNDIVQPLNFQIWAFKNSQITKWFNCVVEKTLVESTTNLKNISTISRRNYAPLLKCFQLDMKPQRAQNKTDLHSPGNSASGMGVRVYVHISMLTSTTGQMSWKQSAYQISAKIHYCASLIYENKISTIWKTHFIHDTFFSSLLIYLF